MWTRKQVYEAVIWGLLLVIVFFGISIYFSLDLKPIEMVAGVYLAFIIGAGIVGTGIHLIRMMRKGGHQFLFCWRFADEAKKLLASMRGEEVAFDWNYWYEGIKGFQVFPGEVAAFEELLRGKLKFREARPGESLSWGNYRKAKL